MTIGGNVNNNIFEGISGILNLDSTDNLSIEGWLEMVPEDLNNIFKALQGVLTAPVYWGMIKTHATHENGFQISGGDFDLTGQVWDNFKGSTRSKPGG